MSFKRPAAALLQQAFFLTAKKRLKIFHSDAKNRRIARGSSKGRTAGFGPANGGSNPPPRAIVLRALQALKSAPLGNMKITREDVEHVAALAGLQFKEGELNTFTRQISNIYQYFEKLQNVDTTNVKPTTHAVNLKNAFREDAVKGSLSPEKALKNAPDSEAACFKVPKVIKV